jgi:hypothetical protein
MFSKLSVYYGRFPIKFCKLSLFLRFARILSKLIDNKMYHRQIKKLNSKIKCNILEKAFVLSKEIIDSNKEIVIIETRIIFNFSRYLNSSLLI